jgi:hypothetical protein
VRSTRALQDLLTELELLWRPSASRLMIYQVTILRQGQQWAEDEERPIDSPALNDDAQNLCNALEAQESVENGHNSDAEGGRNAAPSAAINQSTTPGASGAEVCASASSRPYERELSSQKGQVIKRQRLLREIFVTITDLKDIRQTRLGIPSQCCHLRSRPYRQEQDTPRGCVTPSGPNTASEVGFLSVRM